MGKQTVTRLIDDYTNREVAEGEAVEVVIALQVIRPGEGEDGEPNITNRRWELVYAPDSADKLERAILPFVDGVPEAIPMVKPTGSSIAGHRTPDPRNVHVRAWWTSLTAPQRVALGGLPEPKRNGRIPADVSEAYDTLKPDGHIPATG